VKCASCGHMRSAHEHYQSTSAPGECAICWCPKYAAPLWRLVLEWIRGR
jgi:hypothetical protein